MLVVSRFTVAVTEEPQFRTDAEAALAALSARPGYRSGRLGRAADDPTQWLLVTEWVGVGAWRRALSAYDVKLDATPLLARADAAPSAFEVLYDDSQVGAEHLSSDRAADADSVAVGEASGPCSGWMSESP
jgi:hypothetical protein